jgi:hypothetical protein
MPNPLAPDQSDLSPLSPQNAPPQRLNLLQQAQQQYPVLQGQNYGYVENFGGKGGGFLEHWAAGEGGAPDTPRPSQLPLDQMGLEIRNPKTRPIDVLGDIVSHNLVNTDPTIKTAYQNFQQSLTPAQHKLLAEQYQHSRRHEKEKRSFEDWKNTSGMPSLFRGYAFQQWPQKFNDRTYTPQQKQMFDQMMQYLRGGK